jgi:hypothetical protein
MIASAAKPLKFEPETFKFISSFYIVPSKDGKDAMRRASEPQ